MEISNTFFTSLAQRGACEAAEERCLRYLDAIGLPYAGLTHAAADTIELCENIETRLGAPIVKNLFLCNQQKTAFYLLIMPGKKVFKTKYLSKQIGSARLSFADAGSMEQYLGLQPGSVSVFGLINDTEKKVRLIFDKDILIYDTVGFHPCKNTSTLKLAFSDLTGIFLPAVGYTPAIVELPEE